VQRISAILAFRKSRVSMDDRYRTSMRHGIKKGVGRMKPKNHTALRLPTLTDDRADRSGVVNADEGRDGMLD
jgi:hypothetical protein